MTPLSLDMTQCEALDQGSDVPAVQTGRLNKLCSGAELLGSGGFGRVYRSFINDEQRWCAVKIIPAELRPGEKIEQRNDVWPGINVWERLQRLTAQHVLRYYDYWLEADDPTIPKTTQLSQPQNSSDVAMQFGRMRSDQTDLSVRVSPQRPAGRRGLTSLDGFEAEADEYPLMLSLESRRCSFESFQGHAVFSDDGLFSDDGFDWSKSTKGDEQLELGRSRRASTASAASSSHVFLIVRMEYCKGITLQDWMYQPEVFSAVSVPVITDKLEYALSLGGQLLEGLVELDDAQIVHRDIKPGNLLLEESSGKLKIFDFGLARVAVPDLPHMSSPVSSFERQTTPLVGSAGYAAPEQSGSGTACAHPSADTFSAGVVLFELVMAALKRTENMPVWETAMERAEALQALRASVLELPKVFLQLPVSFRLLLLRMTDPNPEARPTARDALREISAILEDRRHPTIGCAQRCASSYMGGAMQPSLPAWL